MRRPSFLMALVFFFGVLLSGSPVACAAGLTIRDGATLTINGSTLDLNCLDLTIDNGGTFDFASGMVTDCGTLIIDSGGDLISGTGTFLYCESTAGNVSVNPEPDSIDAPWTLEGTSGFYHAGNGDQTLSSLPQGNYTLTWLDTAGWVTPSSNPTTQYLAADDTITFSGTYVMRDSDGDGMPDIWEEQYDLNPSVNDASGDEDSDGYTNLREYQAGTDPTDPDSHPKYRAMPWIPLLLDD